MSYEFPKQPAEVPEELLEYKGLYKMIADPDQPLDLHILKLQELAENLYKKDEEFKNIFDEEMSRVTDPEFDHDGEAENNNDRLQAVMSSFSKYAEKFGLILDQQPMRINMESPKKSND